MHERRWVFDALVLTARATLQTGNAGAQRSAPERQIARKRAQLALPISEDCCFVFYFNLNSPFWHLYMNFWKNLVWNVFFNFLGWKMFFFSLMHMSEDYRCTVCRCTVCRCTGYRCTVCRGPYLFCWAPRGLVTSNELTSRLPVPVTVQMKRKEKTHVCFLCCLKMI